MSRPHDLVAYGATGFTGRQLAFWLRDHAPAGLRWAVGGRSRPKLEKLVQELGVEVPIVVADSGDAAAVHALVRSTRAIASTAGPFAHYGDPLVAACVEHHTDWVDITGETPWVRTLIDRFHARAAAEGTRVVPCCGFDSIPSDLGVWMLADHARSHFGEGLKDALGTFRGAGGFNGGTMASLLDVAEHSGRELRNPRLLCPADVPVAVVRDRQSVDWDEDRQRWLVPFFMAPVNTRVVRRSTALFTGTPEAYGDGFTYDEAMESRSRFEAWMVTGGLGAVFGLLRYPTGRSIARRLLPQPGDGPSEAQMDGGFFRARFTATTTSGRRLQAIVFSKGDPGNRATIHMLGASALSLLDRERLPARAGVLTPATAFGAPLVERLRELGMRWEVGAYDVERLRAG